MKEVYKNQGGYIALITLIIIGAVVLISVITLTFVALNQKNFIISHNYTLKNYYAANACANYAILQLQKNLEYSGSESISLEDVDCIIEAVIGTGNNNRVVIASSQNNNQLKKIKVELEQVKPVTIIKSWGEITE